MLQQASPCIYLQLESQKNAIFNEVIQHLTKELLQITQIKMLQNSLASTHNTHNCLDCLAYKAPSFGNQSDISQIKDLQKLDAIKSSIDSIINEMFNQITKNMNLNDSIIEKALGLKTRKQFPEKLNVGLLEPKIWEQTQSADLFRVPAKEGDTTVSSHSQCSESDSKKNVPKVDRMKNIGFKPRIEKELLEELVTEKDDIETANKQSMTRPTKNVDIHKSKSKRRNYALYCSRLRVRTTKTSESDEYKFSLKSALEDLIDKSFSKSFAKKQRQEA